MSGSRGHDFFLSFLPFLPSLPHVLFGVLILASRAAYLSGMAKFRKAILKTGKYHSPDGVVEVTPERLRHWELQFGRMVRSNQVVPIDWDHADSADALQPLTMDQYHRRRSARNTIGHLADFRVNEAGDAAEITLDLREQAAVEKAAQNTVYVSPVLFPAWKDGAGHEYRDCITHVDMVNHPVDHSQTPFVPVEPQTIACALRMSLSKPYRLASEGPMDDEPITTPEDDTAPDGMGGDPQPSVLPDVLAALAKFNIVLQDGTTEANLLDRLHAALLTAAAHQGKGDEPKPDDEPKPKPDELAKIEDPVIATMSLQTQAALRYAEGQHRASLAKRLKSLTDTGRCTPAEAKQWDGQLTTIKLSLDAKTGEPQPSKLEAWLDSREAVPEGTFWTDKQRLSLAHATVINPPANMRGDMTPDEIKATADWALGKR